LPRRGKCSRISAMSEITVCPERPEDIPSIHQVNALAFGRGAEAHIVDTLRERGALPVSLVAVLGGRVVGHIAFSPAEVEGEGSGFPVACLGPISVLPEHQRTGIGSKLMRAGLEECRRLGHEIIVLVGHADYYPRFGFVQALPLGLVCEYEAPTEAWMVLELAPGALVGRRGTVKFRPEFQEGV
jgi:putative acetyltransferase